MELFVSGVKVPRLGSSADKVIRDYLLKRSSKELHKNKLLAQLALNTAGNSKEISNSVTESWNDYVNLAFYLENNKQQKEIDMQEEYARWKKITPKIKLGKDGGLTVSGLPT